MRKGHPMLGQPPVHVDDKGLGEAPAPFVEVNGHEYVLVDVVDTANAQGVRQAYARAASHCEDLCRRIHGDMCGTPVGKTCDLRVAAVEILALARRDGGDRDG